VNTVERNCKLQIANCKLQIEENPGDVRPEAPPGSVCANDPYAAACGSLHRHFFNLQFAICNLQFAISLSLCVLLPLTATAAPVEVPIVGRPGYFSEAVGKRFQVSMRTDKSEMYVGQYLKLTVRVQAVGPFQHPPVRPDLREAPHFARRFKIDNSVNDLPDRTLDQRAWEFDYRLRPLDDQVERIPPLPFVWYRPNKNAGLRGHFFTTYGDEIELKVKPVKVSPSEKDKKEQPIQAPDRLFELAEGNVSERQETFRAPTWPASLLLLFGPLAVAGAWCLVWKRLYPDAARRARIRQSRAGMEAFRALKSLNGDGSERVWRVASITATYLRHRFDLPGVEPTPPEVARHLQNAGAQPDLAEQAADFFRACDAVRFAPSAAHHGVAVETDAHRLITRLEAEL
jgi:hypothetical protein